MRRVKALSEWIGLPFQYGDRVKTVDAIEKRDYTVEGQHKRQPNTLGTVTDFSNSHGLCFQVRYDNGNDGWYDTDELMRLPVEYTEPTLKPEPECDIESLLRQFKTGCDYQNIPYEVIAMLSKHNCLNMEGYNSSPGGETFIRLMRSWPYIKVGGDHDGCKFDITTVSGQSRLMRLQKN